VSIELRSTPELFPISLDSRFFFFVDVAKPFSKKLSIPQLFVFYPTEGKNQKSNVKYCLTVSS